MSDDSLRAAVDRLLETVSGPPGTGPHDWRWCCRICGAKGVADDRAGRDANAFGHAPHVTGQCAEARRLLNVW